MKIARETLKINQLKKKSTNHGCIMCQHGDVVLQRTSYLSMTKVAS